jgi:hypothetical protein
MNVQSVIVGLLGAIRCRPAGNGVSCAAHSLQGIDAPAQEARPDSVREGGQKQEALLRHQLDARQEMPGHTHT